MDNEQCIIDNVFLSVIPQDKMSRRRNEPRELVCAESPRFTNKEISDRLIHTAHRSVSLVHYTFRNDGYGRFLSIFLLSIITTFLFPSCIKQLEKEGIYDTTLCSGVLLDQRTNNPVADARISLTDGELVPLTVVSGRDGSFEIEIDCNLAGKGYYLKVEADSLYESRTIALTDMGFGKQFYEIGSVYVVGPDLPLVSTMEFSAVTATSVHCGGNVTDGGRSDVVSRGLCWSKMQYPTLRDSVVAVGNGTGVFEATISTLHYNTTYYIRAYATNGVGTSYGEQLSFTTCDGLPSVTTGAVSSVTPTTASSGGNVVSDGGFAVTTRGVCWSTTM